MCGFESERGKLKFDAPRDEAGQNSDLSTEFQLQNPFECKCYLPEASTSCIVPNI